MAASLTLKPLFIGFGASTSALLIAEQKKGPLPPSRSGLKKRPSDLIERNCWISFEPVEGSHSVLADYIGPHKIMWATDYPHSDGFFPEEPQMMGDRLQPLSPEARHLVMTGGLWGSAV